MDKECTSSGRFTNEIVWCDLNSQWNSDICRSVCFSVLQRNSSLSKQNSILFSLIQKWAKTVLISITVNFGEWFVNGEKCFTARTIIPPVGCVRPDFQDAGIRTAFKRNMYIWELSFSLNGWIFRSTKHLVVLLEYNYLPYKLLKIRWAP